MAKTTYTKLRSGAWGVRVEGATPAVGEAVTVTKKSGETKDETIERVLFKGEGFAVCAIRQREASYAGGSRGYGGRSYGRGGGCSCSDGCCDDGCRCNSTCNCRGGYIYDC